jgi:AraC family transcriptional regulator of adaptative response/methylated-DNA-[protein]-cysteine methyltransferase
MKAKTPTKLSEAQMRNAVTKRDPSYDGRFFFGVVTTGVVCRPSCGARPARPENLRFFTDIDAALTAGFRVCKRCRPVEFAAAHNAVVQTARYIEAEAEQSLPLALLAKRVAMSPGRLQKAFKAAFGVSPKVYQSAQRLRRLKGALQEGAEVTNALYAAGYGSPSRLYEGAARNIGMTPKTYREGGRGESISFACRKSCLGQLLMAATERGVCFVQFGESAEALFEQLVSEFPNAELTQSKAATGVELDAWITALDAHMAGAAPRPELPLDLRGTAFQLQVWQLLLSVREGEVFSYAELAQRLGNPGAVRAVASACGANRVGVLVPCHRILRSDGGLGGYRWGLERKRALLAAERSRGKRLGSE